MTAMMIPIAVPSIVEASARTIVFFKPIANIVGNTANIASQSKKLRLKTSSQSIVPSFFVFGRAFRPV
jgi:hypothetical protein